MGCAPGSARPGAARLAADPELADILCRVVWGKNERHLKWPQKKKPPKPCLSEMGSELMLKHALLSGYFCWEPAATNS